jgi:hypothetical protein
MAGGDVSGILGSAGVGSKLRMSMISGRFVVSAVWFAAFGATLMMLSGAHQVNAHSWYPLRCCGDQDCRKVDKIDYLPDGGMVMHAGPMEVFVPHYFLQEPSEDGDAHVCAVSLTTGTYLPVCVFMPGTT